MKNPKFWIAVLVSGIVANVIDFVGQGQVLASAVCQIADGCVPARPESFEQAFLQRAQLRRRCAEMEDAFHAWKS